MLRSGSPGCSNKFLEVSEEDKQTAGEAISLRLNTYYSFGIQILLIPPIQPAKFITMGL